MELRCCYAVSKCIWYARSKIIIITGGLCNLNSKAIRLSRMKATCNDVNGIYYFFCRLPSCQANELTLGMSIFTIK